MTFLQGTVNRLILNTGQREQFDFFYVTYNADQVLGERDPQNSLRGALFCHLLTANHQHEASIGLLCHYMQNARVLKRTF